MFLRPVISSKLENSEWKVIAQKLADYASERFNDE